MKNDEDRIPPGLWAPLPIPAIKFLANNGHRPASRVLYAIVLHKGNSKSGIFPSYETIRLYASVGENSIRECLDVLENFGFIKVTKSRAGKKNQNNRYQILDKAYSLEINPKAKITKIQEPMICNSCWNDSTIIGHCTSGWSFCPRNKNFECSSEITPEMVIEKIDKCIKDFNI